MTSNVNVNQVVGDTFEDLSISEMVQVQGSGDVVPEFSTSPVCAVSVVTARESIIRKMCQCCQWSCHLCFKMLIALI